MLVNFDIRRSKNWGTEDLKESARYWLRNSYQQCKVKTTLDNQSDKEASLIGVVADSTVIKLFAVTTWTNDNIRLILQWRDNYNMNELIVQWHYNYNNIVFWFYFSLLQSRWNQKLEGSASVNVGQRSGADNSKNLVIAKIRWKEDRKCWIKIYQCIRTFPWDMPIRSKK